MGLLESKKIQFLNKMGSKLKYINKNIEINKVMFYNSKQRQPSLPIVLMEFLK